MFYVDNTLNNDFEVFRTKSMTHNFLSKNEVRREMESNQ